MYIETVKKNMKLPKTVRILDTTLRDGEQTPGVAMTVDEKIRIAQRLDKLGVDTIEVAFPVSSPGEREVAREIHKLNLNSNVCG
ncbi:MAG: 2-isopropylmalate synthase, partial [Methanobacterium paludis]|nr:2-isopropylmalate synthase [Methanobacterium paludis]